MANRRRNFGLRFPRLLLGCTLFALAYSGFLLAQTSTASLTLNARTVIVDVVVTDRHRMSLVGLARQAFSISEDGRPQRITTFEEHPGSDPPPQPGRLPPNVFTNVPRASLTASPIVLLFDSLNTPLSNQALVRKQMLNYLQHLQSGTSMAIFTLGTQLRSVQNFTDDPAALRSVLQNLRSGSGPQASTLLDSRTESTAQTVATQVNVTLQQFLAEQTASQDSARALITLGALQQLARYLAGIPGRKSVIWFSGAFPSYIFPNRALGNPSAVERGFADETRKTDAALAAAQVAIYPFAAEGLANDSLFDVDTQLTGQNAYEIQQQSIASLTDGANLRNGEHATMEQIAEDTGGEAFYNTNDLNKAIQRVAEASSHYYTISYTPATTSRQNHFRKITISVKDQPGAHLAYRRGYFASTIQPTVKPHENRDPLRPYLQPGEPNSTEIPLAFIIQPTATTDSASQRYLAGNHDCSAASLTCWDVSFVIAARNLHFDHTSGGMRHCTIDLTLLANDANGRALQWAVKHVNIDLNASQYTQILSEGIHLSVPLAVSAAAVNISGGVYDPISNLAGTLTVPMAAILAANQHPRATK